MYIISKYVDGESLTIEAALCDLKNFLNSSEGNTLSFYPIPIPKIKNSLKITHFTNEIPEHIYTQYSEKAGEYAKEGVLLKKS